MSTKQRAELVNVSFCANVCVQLLQTDYLHDSEYEMKIQYNPVMGGVKTCLRSLEFVKVLMFPRRTQATNKKTARLPASKFSLSLLHCLAWCSEYSVITKKNSMQENTAKVSAMACQSHTRVSTFENGISLSALPRASPPAKPAESTRTAELSPPPPR